VHGDAHWPSPLPFPFLWRNGVNSNVKDPEPKRRFDIGRPKGEPLQATILQVIRIANREFQDFAERFSEQDPAYGQYAEAARRLGKVSLRLKQVERVLARRAEGDQEEPELDQAVLEYGENLKALKKIVENLELMLLARKSRFEDARAHLQAANAWATSMRQIS